MSSLLPSPLQLFSGRYPQFKDSHACHVNVHEGFQAIFLDILFKLQKAAYVHVEEEGGS